jgi:cell division protein FtsB
MRASGAGRVGGASRAGTGSRPSEATRESQASPNSRNSLRPGSVAGPKLTSRAAVLAIVVCAIALTLAYPVREYIAERRQIDQLAATNAHLAATVQHMRAEARSLNSPAVIAQEARDDLHMCFPSETCYEVIFPARPHSRSAAQRTASPWYGRLWESVKKADGTSTR